MPLTIDTKTKRSIARIVLIGLGLLAIALMVDVPESTDSYDEYASQVEQLRRDGHRQLVVNDSLKKVIADRDTLIRRSDRRVASLNQQLDVLRGQTAGMEGELDSLKETLTDSVSMAREIIPRQEKVIENKNKEIQSQGLIITEHLYTISLRDSSIVNLRVSNDSLSGIIRRMRPAPPNPNKLFGVIPMPSRTTAFVVGGAAGAAAAAIIMSK